MNTEESKMTAYEGMKTFYGGSSSNLIEHYSSYSSIEDDYYKMNMLFNKTINNTIEKDSMQNKQKLI